MRRNEHNPRPGRGIPNESLAENPYAYTAFKSGGGNPFEKTQEHFAYSKEEEAINQALEAAFAAAPPEHIRPLFPPRTGYDREVPGLVEIMAYSRFMGPEHDRRMDYSGVETRYQATTRPGIGMV